MLKNNAFVAKIVNMRLTKICMAIFAPNERLPSSATLHHPNFLPSLRSSGWWGGRQLKCIIFGCSEEKPMQRWISMRWVSRWPRLFVRRGDHLKIMMISTKLYVNHSFEFAIQILTLDNNKIMQLLQRCSSGTCRQIRGTSCFIDSSCGGGLVSKM